MLLRNLLMLALAGGPVACASTPNADADKDSPKSGISRLQAFLINGEASLDELELRRKALDRTFIYAPPRSDAFQECIDASGFGDGAMAQCEYAESVELDRQLEALLDRLGDAEASKRFGDQAAWEAATREGCAWLPLEEGTMAVLASASCVTNRLAHRVAELSGKTCHIPAAGFEGQPVICTVNSDDEDRQGEALVERRADLDPTFRDAEGNTPAFATCLADTGGVTDALLACIDEEQRKQQARIDERFASQRNADGNAPEARRSWQQETAKGCVWYPTLEGSAARIDSASCVLNRVTNFADRLSDDAMEASRDD